MHATQKHQYHFNRKPNNQGQSIAQQKIIQAAPKGIHKIWIPPTQARQKVLWEESTLLFTEMPYKLDNFFRQCTFCCPRSDCGGHAHQSSSFVSAFVTHIQYTRKCRDDVLAMSQDTMQSPRACSEIWPAALEPLPPAAVDKCWRKPPALADASRRPTRYTG